MKVSTKTSVRTGNTNSLLTVNANDRASKTGARYFRGFLSLVVFVCLSISGVKAQLTGTKNIPADYPTLAAAIADLNTQGVGAGGVTINVTAGNAQTAPAGGYVIGGTGSAVLTSSSALNPIVITGNLNTVTAGLQTAGNLNDAVFKLVGADWVTIQGFDMQENAGNTVITVVSNTMTEWGVAILPLDASNGSQNNTIQNNNITMNGTYSQSFGIYSTTRHIDGPASVDVTSLLIASNNTTAPNHGNKVYGNTINNANMPFVLIGAGSTTNQDVGNDWGGSSAATGNTATGWGAGGLISTAYPGVPTTTQCATYVGNQVGYNFSYNTLISANLNTASGVRGAILDYTNAPTQVCTNNANNNTFTITQAGIGQILTIVHGTIGPVTLTGVTQFNDNNKFINYSLTNTAAPTFFGILNFAIYDVISMSGNIFRNNTSASTTGGFAGINCQNGGITNGNLTINQLNINNNQFGDALGGPVTFPSTTTGTISPIGISAAATTCTININGNSFRGFSFVNAGTFTPVNITSAATPAAINVNNNLLGAGGTLATYSGSAGANAFSGLIVAGVPAANGSISVSNNDFRGLNHTNVASGAQTYITVTGATNSGVTATINGNTYTNLTSNTTGAITFISYGMVHTAGVSISNNSISGTYTKLGASGNVVIATSASSPLIGSSLTMTGNNFSNITVAGSSTITGFTNLPTYSNATKTITGNTFNNWQGVTGAITGITMGGTGGGVNSISNNTITNLTNQTTITGLNINASPNQASVFNVSNNTITGLSSTGTGGSVTGLSCSNASSVVNISSNTINTLSSTGASSTVLGLSVTGGYDTRVTGNNISAISGSGATSPIATGMQVSGGTTITLNANKICNISESGAISTTAGAVNGIVIASGPLNVNVTNNLVADLRAPSASLDEAIRGISITSTTTLSSYNIYHNTVYLSAAAGGANFGTTGLHHAASATVTTSKLDLRNNIIVNNSIANGTGVASALRRSAAATYGNYAVTSNNNLFYAGTPGASNVILNDNGTVYQTMAAFQTQVTAAREAQSFSTAVSGTPGVFFQDFDCSNASTFLHIVNGLASRIEGGGLPIASVTTDYDGQARSGTNPDIGADEFTGTSVNPVISGVTVPTNACTPSTHNISATVTTPSGNITTVTLNYNNGSAGSVAMTTGGGGVYTGTIPAGTAGTIVTWSITAYSDVPASTTFTGSTYVDDPLVNFNTSVTASANPACSTNPVVLTANLSTAAPATYSPAVAASTPTVDEDLGNITIMKGVTTVLNNTTTGGSLSGTIGTATGTAGGYSDFTAFGPYTLNPGSTYTFSLSSITQNTSSNFGNAIAMWIDYNKNGVFTDAGEQIYLQPSTIAGPHTVTGSFVVPYTATSGKTRMRVLVNEGTISGPTMSVTWGEYEDYMVDLVPVITGINWDAGGPSLGTTNPITVNPVSATTYTATISAAGCTKTPSLLVNTNALPAAPIGSNSTQCGFGIPTNSVVTQFVTPDVSAGLFRWYDGPGFGANLLQSGGSTFTSPISTTTIFYVSESNGTCESPRTALTATVSQPDPISAHVTDNNPCINTPITLSVTNDAGTPANFYSYSWSVVPGAGSGISGTPTGSTVTPVIPTAAGTYTYRVDAVDPGVNPPSTSCATFATVSVVVKPAPIIDSVRANPSSICAGASVALKQYSALVTSGPQVQPSGYCVASLSSTTEDDIGQVTFANINNPAVRPTPQTNNAAANKSYTDYTGTVPAANVYTGVSYPITVYHFHDGTDQSANFVNVYIDFNRNGLFTEANEVFTLSKPGSTFYEDFVGTITIPSGATPGLTRMRVVLREGAITTMCGSLGTWGEVEDYLVNIGSLNTQDPSLSYAWSWPPSNTATGANLTVTPAVTTTYTATATGTNGCVSLPSTVSVTVNQLPAALSGSGSVQCGEKIPEANVSSNSGAPTPVFRWYDAPAPGGNLLQESTSATYLLTINSTKEFYVCEVSAAGCEGPRLHITAEVNAPDVVQATVSSSPYCINSQITLNANHTQVNNIYNFVWTASPAANSGIPAPVQGDDGDGVNGGSPIPVNATPTVAGTYTYTVTADDPVRGCTTTSSVTVIINPRPTSVVAASTGTPCIGSTIGLTSSAQTGGPLPINYSEGFEGTFPPSGWTIINAGTGGNWVQTTTATNVHSGTAAMWTIRVVGQATNTYAISTSQALVGGHTYTLKFWYRTNSLSGALPENLKIWAGTSPTVAGMTTTVANFVNLINETFVQATVNYVCPATGNYYFAFNAYAGANLSNVLSIDDVTLVDATPLIISSYNWTSDNSNPVFTSSQQNPTGVVINEPTTYTVTVANSEGCTSNASVLVTPNALPPSPIGTNSNQCGLRVPTASVSTGGANGTFKWYDGPGLAATLLQDGGSTYTTAISATTTFYVSEYNGTCESPRIPVTVTVATPDPVSAHVDISPVCANSPISLSATNDNPTPNNTYTYSWTASPATGSGISGSVPGSPVTVTPTLNGTFNYLVTATDLSGGPFGFGPCATTATVPVVVNKQPEAIVITPAAPSICPGGNVTINAISGGTGVVTITSPTIGTTIPDVNATGISNTLAISGVPAGATIDSVIVTLNVAFSSFVQDIGANLTAPNGQIINLINSPTGTTVTGTNFTNTRISSDDTKPLLSSGTAPYTATFRADKALSGFELAPTPLPTTATWSSLYSIPNGNWTMKLWDDESIGTGTWTNWTIKVAYSLPSAPITWSSEPGLNTYTGSTVIASPAATTTWTATATGSNSCTITNTVTVNVVNPATAPTATPSTSCAGSNVVLAANATFGGTPTFKWYALPDAVTVINTNPTFTANPLVTTTYRVTVTDGCGNTSTPQDVMVNVNPLPTASIQEGPGPISICDPATQLLTAVTDVASPSYQWTLNGVNIPTATGSTYTVSGVSTGTYRVVITNTLTNCVNTSAGVVVTINQKPSTVVITPASASICINGSQNYSASGGQVFAVTTKTITGTSPTTSTSTTVPFYRLWEGSRKQYLISPSELAAQGLVTGSTISSVSFNVTSVTSPNNLDGFNIKIGATATTDLSSAFVSTGLGVVYGPVSYSPVLGSNTFNFSSSFTWDGSSYVVLEICFDNDPNNTCSAGSPTCWGNTPTVSVATGFTGCVREIHDDNTTGARDICSLTSTSNGSASSTLRPVMVFNVTVPTNPTYTWTASPVAGSGIPTTLTGSPVTITPTAPGNYVYTALATNPTSGCTNQTTATLTVNALPVITIDPVTTPTCLNSSVQTLSATPAGGTFSGPGVSGNTFDPAVAGVGTHTITYSYTDPSTTCSNTATTSILVNGLPPAPVISIVDNVNGTSTITATNVVGTLNWSNGGSDNPHIVIASGPYWATQTSLVTGCTSVNSNIVTAGPSITADPALGNMDITDLADVSQNANILPHAQVLKLKVPVYNFEQDYPVPNGATTIKIDLGTKLVVNPSFNMATAPLSAYFSWSHAVVLGHDVITGSQIADLPGDFDNTAVFEVISSGSCISDIKSNFIIDNHASVVALNDLDPNNNFARLQYGLPTTVSATFTNVLCNGAADGTITITASEGTTVTVNGNPPQATYGPGTYTIVATAPSDVAPFTACTATTTVTITEPTLLVPAIFAQVNVTGCYGDHTGSAAVFVTGGTPFAGPAAPYLYSWNTVPVQTTPIATGLGAGTYTVTVTDANGCVKTATVTITEPTQVIASITAQTDVDCHGNNTGSATVSASGGSPFAGPNFYTYSWDDPAHQTGATATGLAAGTYTVTVTDSHGCIATASVTITEPAVLTAVATVDNQVSCNGAANGQATVVVSGGTANYTYLWSDPGGQTTPTASHLAPGTYTVFVTDAHNCTVTSNTVTITQPNVLVAVINNQTNISCHGGSTGSLTAGASGGTTTYTFTIAGPTVNNTGQLTGVFTGLTAGTYTITVTDANGCVATTAPATITQPVGTLPDISLGSDYTSNFFGSNGASTTIIYNVAEIAGNAAVGDTIRITKVAGYTFSFNSSLTANPITPANTLDNPRWKIDNSNPAFVSLIFDPAHNSTPGTLNCQERVYVAVTVTRNTPNLSTYTLSARLRRANSEVNLANNLNSIVFTAE